jgi:hypothetical protein
MKFLDRLKHAHDFSPDAILKSFEKTIIESLADRVTSNELQVRFEICAFLFHLPSDAHHISPETLPVGASGAGAGHSADDCVGPALSTTLWSVSHTRSSITL